MLRSLAISALLLPLCGCYSIVTLNLASINKQVGSTGPPMSPAVECAALLNPTFKIRKRPAGIEQDNEMKLCEEIVTRQRERRDREIPENGRRAPDY